MSGKGPSLSTELLGLLLERPAALIIHTVRTRSSTSTLTNIWYKGASPAKPYEA